ncbi:hypothetical protein IEI94_13640 [Halomonas sp. ML-15]|uniref:hypothetical protein n=1 Tax=Halomonas sp. ML-15 TaxID=2773305 RepID=UPI0017471DD2|nr:hypothetical protein [Halomonas sp. ML-15]MBD3896897.1 hypothetical protein [Halomonas sp. ML-15]
MRLAILYMTFTALTIPAYAQDVETDITALFEAIFDEEKCPEYYANKAAPVIEEYTFPSAEYAYDPQRLIRVECNLSDLGGHERLLHVYFLSDGKRFSHVSFANPSLGYRSEDLGMLKGYVTRPGLMDAKVDEAEGRIIEDVSWYFEETLESEPEQEYSSRGEWYFSNGVSELRYYEEVVELGAAPITVLDLR